MNDLVTSRRMLLETPGWFRQHYTADALNSVAYFSMEFMLGEALPIYSGGLGNVAGDQLKAASDLGLPVIGVGLLYQRGYFRQVIDSEGAQQALYPYNDPGQLPITPLRKPNGEWLRVELAMPGQRMWLRTWHVQIGRATLYLLDSNDSANVPSCRGITSELYGGGAELRLMQEMVLGIGGWRLLAELGVTPEVCHLNEGHAAFAVLERARHFMAKSGQSFEVALAATRAGNLFTTHTAVAAAFDRFAPALIERYLGEYAQSELGVATHDLVALGRRDPNDSSEEFNMSHLAIRGSGAVNGVSRLHGGVSRRLFQPLFPRWPEIDVPVGHVTNGVHAPSWDSAAADALWTETSGPARWLGETQSLTQEIQSVSDEKLWALRTVNRASLVSYARERLSRQLATAGAPPKEVADALGFFDPSTLTLGFARRFATYKRPNLLLHDPDRLLRLLSNIDCPVQLILAGKAHPADQAGQALIQQWTRFIRRDDVRAHVIFLSDYDVLLTEHLVQGVDLWINTPQRPWEASGTSGMKVLVNGGLNLSELDGWWAEAYAPDVGWALGDGKEHGDDKSWDAAEAEALYDLLEREVIPEFYTRNEHHIPTRWVARIRESMGRLAPYYSANRAVREYAERYYVPAAAAYRSRAVNRGALARELVDWRHTIEQHWDSVRFGTVKTETHDDQHFFEIEIYLGELTANAVQAELYGDGTASGGPVRQELTRDTQLAGGLGGWLYRGRVSATRPATSFTARVIPRYPGTAVPLESTHIQWQR